MTCRPWLAGDHVPSRADSHNKESTSQLGPEVTKIGKKSVSFLYILYMAENEHELVSRRDCQSLPSKYREGAELREGAEPIKAVKEKALVGGFQSPVPCSWPCRGVEGSCHRCCSLCLKLHEAVVLR